MGALLILLFILSLLTRLWLLYQHGMLGFPNTARWNLSFIGLSLLGSIFIVLAYRSFGASRSSMTDLGLFIFLALFNVTFDRILFPYGNRRSFERARKSRESTKK